MHWRLVDTGPGEAHYNMALDEAISETVRKGSSPPTLRFFGWDVPSVSIGSSQRAGDVDLGYCASSGIPVVRRPTGGRAILHGDELTYSFASGTTDGVFSGNLFKDYRKLGIAFSMAFSVLGVENETVFSRRASGERSPICFQSSSYGEITVGRRKVIGSAQRRWPDGLLQQGSIPYSIDHEGMRKVFPGGKGASPASMAGLREFLPGLGPGKLKSAVVSSFLEVFGISIVESLLTDEEEALTQRLLREKYLLPGWNLRR
jgi:lipoate-protein ligase A